MDLTFIIPEPGIFCISYPLLYAGHQLPKYDCIIVTEEDGDNSSLKDITIMANKLCRKIEQGIKTYFHFSKNSQSALPTLCCVLRRLEKRKYDSKTAIRFVKSAALSAGIKWVPDKEQIWMVENYKPPVKVLFCGDRNNAICFERMILFELKNLPEDSIVVHGGCKGVDLFTDELARGLGITTKVFAVTREDWNVKGLSAGPQRNEKMLQDDEGPPLSYVMAFHPEIEMSKGTKDMMLRAWKSGVPVYIHDLKRKSKFEGDFTVL